ncbi:hypothetical protein [uncultured Desulfuromusa sp.]|uniref:hypothetical protein n=1 Tax=uncultured Desulfuromusa sp. TaxID=219183 RepID=UPI002AA85B4C|nr:hypothetical protein [uncultured Desulfuromusa sp.]
MENQDWIRESVRSRKRTFVRRMAMLIVFGFFFWQIAGGFLGPSVSAVSSERYCGSARNYNFSDCSGG